MLSGGAISIFVRKKMKNDQKEFHKNMLLYYFMCKTMRRNNVIAIMTNITLMESLLALSGSIQGSQGPISFARKARRAGAAAHHAACKSGYQLFLFSNFLKFEKLRRKTSRESLAREP